MLAVTGCTSDTQQSADNSKNASDTTLKIGLMPDIDSIPFIIAEEKGFFKEEGLDIENKLMTGPDENASLVASGDAKICFGSMYNNISVAANGVKVKVVSPLVNAAGTQSVVARKGLEINSPKDLEGKKLV